MIIWCNCLLNYTELPLPAINLSSVHACAVRVSREVIKFGPKNYEFSHIISSCIKLKPDLELVIYCPEAKDSQFYNVLKIADLRQIMTMNIYVV